MKEIFLLTNKISSENSQKVIVLLVEYHSQLKSNNHDMKMQFQSNSLKDLGYFAVVSKTHNQYKNIPVRLGNLDISDSNLEFNNILGKAIFTENSAEITSSEHLVLINNDDYVPISVKVGVLMNIDNYVDDENSSNEQSLSIFTN